MQSFHHMPNAFFFFIFFKNGLSTFNYCCGSLAWFYLFLCIFSVACRSQLGLELGETGLPVVKGLTNSTAQLNGTADLAAFIRTKMRTNGGRILCMPWCVKIWANNVFYQPYPGNLWPSKWHGNNGVMTRFRNGTLHAPRTRTQKLVPLLRVAQVFCFVIPSLYRIPCF